MQSILILTIVVLVSSCTLTRDVILDQQWNLWKDIHNKYYSDVEENHRRTIWENNLKIVEKHNLQADLGIYTYWLGMNKYTDLIVDEFKKVSNGFHGKIREERSQNHQTFTLNPNIELLDTVDWRDKGDVVHVKNQGQCGSNWAFSAIGSIESAYAIKTGKLVALSEQQLVDCSSKYGNMGCNGGLMNQAFKYLIDTGGIESDDSYPYVAVTKICVFNTSNVVVRVCGFTDIASKDEATLQQVVAIAGPVSAAIDKYAFFDPLGCSVLTENGLRYVEQQIKETLQNESLYQGELPSISQSNLFSSTSSSATNQFLLACGKTHLIYDQKTTNRRLTIDEELRIYEKYITDYYRVYKLVASALIFWKQYHIYFPVLAKLARDYLSTPGTSISSKPAFSLSAYVTRKERARLSPENLSYSIFMKDKTASKD